MPDAGATTRLDTQMFEQALAVLERAKPSPREDRLFRLLNQAVWTAVALTAAFLLLRLPGVPLGRASAWMARAIALVYLSIIPLFVVNWRLVNKLRAAGKVRRGLAPSLRSRVADRFRAKRRKRRIVNVATFVLSLVGYVVGGIGLLGLLLELLPDEPVNYSRLTLFVVAAVFGLSCIFLHFMSRARERLQVIYELGASLVASKGPTNEGRLPPADYDEILRIQRGQINDDRRRSVKAASRETLTQTFSSKEHRRVREVKLTLEPETLVRVQACIEWLTSHPQAAEEAAAKEGDVSYLAVPDTPMVLGFVINWDLRETKVLLLRTGEPRTPPAVADRSDES